MVSDNKRKITLVGYGGHAIVVADTALALGVPLKYYVNKSEVLHNPFKLSYLGDEWSDNFDKWDECSFVLGLGCNTARMEVADLIENRGSKLESIIHPDSSISICSELGEGVFIARNVSVSPQVNIGANSILNTGCIVEHDCEISEGVHVAPGAVLAGNVKVGKKTFIGMNASIKQGVVLGDNVVIGAGAVVLKNVPSGSKAVGVPARIS